MNASLKPDMIKGNAIRWAVGAVDGLRSSTWRLWGNKKGDIYVSTRTMGEIIKASLHRDRNCHVGFTTAYADTARKRFSHVGLRHWHKWTLQDGPLVRAMQIVVPVSELRVFQSNELKVYWLPMPASGSVAVVTIYIAKYGAVKWPETLKAFRPLGVIITETHIALVVYSSNLIDAKQNSFIEKQRAIIKSKSAGFEGADKPGVRTIIFGDTDPYSKFFLELALD